MKIFLSVLAMLFLVSFGVCRVVNHVEFKQNCSGYLKLAADSNTIELAQENLEKALKYMEAKNYTSGYTSVLWRTQDEDVGFWYRNAKASLNELKTVKPDASQLEKTNVLMRLRETLLDSSSEGYSVTAPEGISVYPYNLFYVVWGILGVIIGCLGFVVFYIEVFD